ncbi:MAG: hypothetical protein ACMXYD_02975 [Candidatus Woesearchaeota archaeon]
MQEDAETKITVYKGFEEVKNYYNSINQTLQEGDEVLVFGARSGNPHSPEALAFFNELIKNRVEKKIYTKLLFNNDHKHLAKRYENTYTQYKFMPLGLLTEAGIDIYKNKVNILIWSQEQPRLILIEDNSVAESYKDYFNFMWSSANLIEKQITKGTYWLPEVLFEEYCRYTNEKEILGEEITKLLSKHKPKSLLEIGSGFGDVITIPSNIEYTIVEKNAGFFQTNNTQVQFIDSSWEKFETEKTFDTILASHTIFYFTQEPKHVLESMFEKLSSNGKIILVFNAPTGDYAKLKKHVYYLKSEPCTFTYKLFEELIKPYTDQEYDIKATLLTTDINETYRALRFLFENDLDVYLRNKESIQEQIREITQQQAFTITNRIVVLSKP